MEVNVVSLELLIGSRNSSDSLKNGCVEVDDDLWNLRTTVWLLLLLGILSHVQIPGNVSSVADRKNGQSTCSLQLEIKCKNSEEQQMKGNGCFCGSGLCSLYKPINIHWMNTFAPSQRHLKTSVSSLNWCNDKVMVWETFLHEEGTDLDCDVQRPHRLWFTPWPLVLQLVLWSQGGESQLLMQSSDTKIQILTLFGCSPSSFIYCFTPQSLVLHRP